MSENEWSMEPAHFHPISWSDLEPQNHGLQQLPIGQTRLGDLFYSVIVCVQHSHIHRKYIYTQEDAFSLAELFEKAMEKTTVYRIQIHTTQTRTHTHTQTYIETRNTFGAFLRATPKIFSNSD